MTRLISSERGERPDDLPQDDFIALNYPLGYVLKTWYEHRQHGTFPEAGAYNDQDALLMDDWSSIDRKYLAILADVLAGLKEVEFSTDGKNWMDTVNG